MSEEKKEEIGGLDDDQEMTQLTLTLEDGQKIAVRKKVAMMSELIKTMAEGESEIPLTYVRAATLKRIVSYMEYHANNPPKEIEKPLKSANMKEVVSPWDAEFVDVEQEVLFELILAANFMDIKSLLDLTCAKVACTLKGKTPEQIRKQFNIQTDFTLEEFKSPQQEATARSDWLRLSEALESFPDVLLNIVHEYWGVPPLHGKLARVLESHSKGVMALCVLGDGRLASGSVDYTIRIWSVDTGECALTLRGHTSAVYALCVLGDGRLASGSDDKTVRIWSVDTGECALTLNGHTSIVFALCVLGDGRLASGSFDRTVRIWSVDTGECALTLRGHTKWVKALCVLGDGRLASGSVDYTIRIWSVDTGECALTLRGHTSAVYALCVLGDGRLASGSDDYTVRIWSVDTGECALTLRGHTYIVRALCVLGDGRLASGSYDTTVRIWSADTGECALTLRGHTDYVNALCVLGDGRLASGSDDNTVRIWR